MQIVIVVAETIVGSLWSAVNLKQDLLLLCKLVYVFFTRYFSKRSTRIDVLLINVPASALFTADSKFLTSFLTITISSYMVPTVHFLSF